MFSAARDSIFLAVLLLCFAVQQPWSLVLGALMCALYAIFSWHNSTVDLTLLKICLVLIAIVFIPVLRQDHGFSPVFYIFSTTFAILAAYRFSSLPLSHVRLCLEVVFWLAVLGLACGIFIYRHSAEPIGEIIPGASTNGLPSYLIVFQVALSISVLVEKNKLPTFSAFATLVIAVFGLGRGSIVVAALIFSASLFLNYFIPQLNPRKSVLIRWFVGLLFLSVALGMLVYGWYFGILSQSIEQTKFSAGLLDPHRGSMLADYLGKMDGWGLVFGADYSDTSIALYYGNNPHNSYIRVHSYYGIIGFLITALSPFAIFLMNKNTLYKAIVFMLVGFVMMRAVTEPILFPTLLDFFYVLYFFLFWKYAPSGLPAWRRTC